MRIKQTMKSLGIISLTAMIIPLILGPTTSVYAQEKSTTESSATEVQQSIEQLKDPLSIASKLEGSTESIPTEETLDSATKTSEENEETVTDDSAAESHEEESTTEQSTAESKKSRATRGISGDFLFDDSTVGAGYLTLTAYIGTSTHLIVPETINGQRPHLSKEFFQSLANTNVTDFAISVSTTSLKPLIYSDMSWALAGNNKIINIDLSNATSAANSSNNFNGMFANCSNLKNVKMMGSYFNYTSSMFEGCGNLESVDMGASYVNIFPPSSPELWLGARDTSRMFANCIRLTNVNMSQFKTDIVTNMTEMFLNCTSLPSLDLSTFKTDYVTSMSRMFEGCKSITNINAANWITGRVTTMHKMFANCENLPQLYLTHFDTTQVYDMSGMFINCQKLISSMFSFTTNTQNVISMADMYNGCSSLTSLDISHMNTLNVQNMYGMFANCPSLVTLKLNGPSFNTQNVVDMSFMFAGDTALTNLDVSHFNTGKVQNMAYMFASNQNLAHVNVTSFNTSSVTNMAAMFAGTEKIKNLNLTSFNTHIVSNMTDMFKTSSQKELFVLTNDAKILNHGYHLDNRVPPEILLQANYGQFSDSSTSKNFFTRCALTPAQATISEVKNFISGNTPTRTNRTFEGWTLVSGIDVNATGTFTDLFGTIYKAKWNSFGLAQVPTAKTFSGNLNKGTITIPSSGTTNEVGVLDESSDTKGWTLTAQLVWSGTAPNSTTTLRTVSTGTTNEITPTGSIGAAPAGLVTTGANLSISTTPGTVLKGNDSVQQFEGTYVTDLGAISLEIADGSGVIAQSYSGNILWDLAIAP
ncbi:BspA family leucine-rich repeat surface protein [Enterococcus hulanensis]|uniref:BspA family leucine-rich repeat surface protein n=1 Tax=Enterococcus hulanensis TaxID=2559929 RepID=UPI001A8E423E|nr:BspA family leucine-rich repeat surface protein [Enterococcus hulanensis]MBO0456638.1 BspA family leucine-rich repeat surface protein [Enterococcus hulanensis]